MSVEVVLNPKDGLLICAKNISAPSTEVPKV